MAHIIIMLPTRGTRKPAPTDARTSRMGRMKPLGAPFFSATSEKEYCAQAHACDKKKKMGRMEPLGAPFFSATSEKEEYCAQARAEMK